MNTTKLAGLLACFSKEQWNQFEHFLQLSYLKVHKKHREIYDYLSYHYWRKKKSQVPRKELFPTKDKLRTKFFPNARKDYKQLNKHLSDLHGHAQSFLAFEQIRADTDKLDLISIQAAIEAEEYHYANTAINRLWKKIEYETEDWYLRCEMMWAKDLLNGKIAKHKKSESLILIQYVLDDFYMLHQIRNYCLSITQQQKLNNQKIQYRPHFDLYYEQYMTRKPYVPLLFQAYHSMLQLLKQENTIQALDTLTQILKENQKKLSGFHINEIQQSLLNYYTILYNKSKIQSIVLLDIYKIFLQAETLKGLDGYLSLQVYRNLIGLSVNAKAFTWLKTKLIGKYLYFLSKENQRIASLLANSEYYFSSKNWREAFDFAAQISSEQLIFKISRGTLLVQAAYEIEKAQFNNLPYRYEFQRNLQNFIALLQYHKTQNERITHTYQNFANIIQRIYNIRKTKNTKYRVKQIHLSISQLKDIARKDWILEKLNDYEN